MEKKHMLSKKKHFHCLSLALVALTPAGLLASDTILIHGHIYTASDNIKWAEAIAMTAGASMR
jgi:hypothetical protein